MKLYNLLSFRLFLLILLILTALNVGFSLYYVALETEQYEEVARQCAQRTSEVVTGATKNAMILNNKENAYEIMQSIVVQNDIEKICLYDKKGNIVFSTVKEEIGQRVGMDSRACGSCHTLTGGIKKEQTTTWHDLILRQGGFRSLSYLKPIKNEESCYLSDCHAHTEDQTYIGVLSVVMSLKKMDILIEGNKTRMISTNIAITLILGLAAGIFLWIGVHIPVNKLIKGTREVSNGNLDYKIKVNGKNEMAVLGGSFNEMTGEIHKAKDEITTWSNRLERRVKEKSEELERTQKRNLQIEKMASLGQLSATVAHELNNPMAGILTYSKLIQKKMNKNHLDEEEKNLILKHLKMIESESARSGNIVKNMLLFSRQETIEMKPQQLNKIIDSSLDLIDHHLKLHNIALVKDYQNDLERVNVDENQIKQALLALFVNAVEAMENDGILTIKTRGKKSQSYVSIFIQDTGKGIPESVRSQIYEPFFTTKNEVKGVGLGLAAVYAIIQRHGGDISLKTKIEEGTTFEIKIPLKKSRTSDT